MEPVNILPFKDRHAFRDWLQVNHDRESECWIVAKRGKPKDDSVLWYLDAVEDALCFGWIDSTNGIVNGVRMQRFTPRRKGSNWTELNKERVRRLESLGLMTDAGRAVLPDMDVSHFTIDSDVRRALEDAGVWDAFLALPPLYVRVRAGNLLFYKTRDKKTYETMMAHLIETASEGKMFGEWNDYGRLL